MLAKEEKKLGRRSENESSVKKAFTDPGEYYKFFINNIDHLEEIYFCGGEPTLLKEQYDVLDLLIDQKKFNVTLRYNTNLSNLSFGTRSIIDRWKYFPKLKIDVSLDASGARAEYIKTSTLQFMILPAPQKGFIKCTKK